MLDPIAAGSKSHAARGFEKQVFRLLLPRWTSLSVRAQAIGRRDASSQAHLMAKLYRWERRPALGAFASLPLYNQAMKVVVK